MNKLMREGYNEFLLTGYCGSFGDIRKGIVVKGSSFIQGDYDSRPLETYPKRLSKSLIPLFQRWQTFISQDRILTTNPYPHNAHGAHVTDMESYAFAAFCMKNKCKFEGIKVVSDIVGESSPKEFLKSCKKYAPKLGEIITEWLG